MEELGRRFIDHKIRGLNIKSIEKNPHSEEVFHYIDKFLNSNGMKMDYSLLQFGDYAFANIASKNIFYFIQIYCYLTFLLDDHLERYPHDGKRFAEYFRKGKCEGNSKIERFLRFYFNESKRLVNKHHLEMHTEMAIKWTEYFSPRELFNPDEHSFTDDDFIKMRIVDVHMPPNLFIFALDTGLEKTEEVKLNENYVRLNEEIGKHIVLVNDLFSFIKENQAGQGKFNYVYVKMINNNLTLEQAMDLIVLEIKESERMAYYFVEKLIANENESLANYATKVTNYFVGNAYYSVVCRRYKNPEIKFFEMN